MWEYTGKVMDHFRNPRNVGVIEDADGIGQVGSLACGDALKLMFKLDDSGRINDVKFQTFGCASAIASSSVMTEMIKGLTLDEAEKLTNQDIADSLGGLPDQKMHCSVMGRDALLLAIDNYRSGHGQSVKRLESRVVCNCFGVSEQDIERAISENSLTTVEEVTNYTKAGGGCGGCVEDIEEILARMVGRPKADEPDSPTPKRRLTIVQKLRLIEETLDREVRPSLRKDGGDIEVVDVIGNQVVVTMRGMCSSCPVSNLTLEGVQAKLREFVADEMVVIEESDLDGES